MTDERWQDLVERFVDGEVTHGTMFGCRGLRTGRKFFAIRWDEQLVLKLPPDRLTALVESGGGTPFEPMEGRRMNGWIVLTGSDDPAPLVEEARAFVAAQSS
jgi:hypothetical protein